MRLTFDFFSESIGTIPCAVTLEPKSGGFVVTEVDASDHDGGELPALILECIEEKAVLLAEDRAADEAADQAERSREDAQERRDSAAFDRSQTDSWATSAPTALQNYEANAEAKGWSLGAREHSTECRCLECMS